MRAIISVFSILIIVINVTAQNIPPKVDSILTPYNNQVFSYPNIYVKVEAFDTDNGVKSVEIKVNDSEWMDAREPSIFYTDDTVYIYENNWLLGVDIELGINAINVRAIDSLDLISDEVSLTVYYEIGNVENWVQQESGTLENLNSVFFIDENLGWAVGDSGVILNTNNGGLTWNPQNSTINSDLYTLHFINEDIGWTTGDGKYDSTAGKFLTPLLRTINGGNEWIKITDLRLDKINTIYFSDINSGWLGGRNYIDGYYGYKTTDGINFNYLFFYHLYSEILTIDVVDSNNIWIGGEDNNHYGAWLRHVSNSGSEEVNPFIKKDYSRFYDIEFIDNNSGWLITHTRMDKDQNIRRSESVSAIKTIDGGNTWTEKLVGIRGPNTLEPPFFMKIDADFINMQSGWIVTTHGLIVHTTNGGEDWIIDGSVNGKDLHSVHFVNENIGYAVGDEGTILKYSTVPVPVELISLTASLDNNKVLLNWSTATETNNKGFEVYRKKSGERSQETEWDLLGYVEGKGTTTELKNYLFKDENPLQGKNIYKLKQIDFDGTFSYSDVVEVDVNLIPQKFELSQNYPNPFNPSTVIKYSLPKEELVKLTVFSILGEEVKILVNEKQSAGNYEIKFDGSGLSNGIYFYRLESGSFIEVKKMVLIK